MKQSKNCVIIGGGIIGLATAIELRSRGWHVTLCDGAAASREASWAAAGMLAPFNEAEDRDAAWQRGCASLQAWEPFLRRHAISSAAVDLHRHGALLPIDDQRAAQRADDLLNLFSKNGVRLLSSDSLTKLAPQLDCPTALWLPGGQVDPRRATLALRRQALKKGVDIRYRTAVTALDATEDDQQRLLLESGESLECDEVVVAAGAWSPELAKLFSIPLAGEPVKGQMCLLAPVQPLGLRQFIHTPNAYLVERKNVGVVIGATMQTVGFDYQPDPAGIATLVDNARRLIPALRKAPLREHWTGMRPRLQEGQLLVDRIRPGLAVATGHFRNGILLAPWTATRLADRLEGKQRPHYEHPCNWSAA